MQKKYVSLIMAVSIFVGSCSMTTLVNADPKQAIEQNTFELKQINSDILDLNSKISNLNGEITELNSKIKETNSNIDNLKSKIKNTEIEINKVKKDIDTKNKLLGDRMRAMYKSGHSYNPLTFLISSENVSDFISRANAAFKIISLDQNLIDDLSNEKTSLSNDIDKLNKKNDDLLNLQATNEQALESLNEKKSEFESNLNKFNEEKAKVASIIEENENSLVSNFISTINSENSNSSIIESNVKALKQLLPMLTSNSAKSKAENAINVGNNKIEEIKRENNKSNENSNDKNNNNNNNVNDNTENNGEIKTTYTMEATAYCDGFITASGIPPVRNPSGLSTIAVDQSVIPLGTRLYIPGYGLAIAADTGGDIIGNRIDLYMNSRDECLSFGRKTVTVHVLK